MSESFWMCEGFASDPVAARAAGLVTRCSESTMRLPHRALAALASEGQPPEIRMMDSYGCGGTSPRCTRAAGSRSRHARGAKSQFE